MFAGAMLAGGVKEIVEERQGTAISSGCSALRFLQRALCAVYDLEGPGRGGKFKFFRKVITFPWTFLG